LDREQGTFRDLLSGSAARLQERFIRAEQLETVVNERLPSRVDGRDMVLPWQCAAMSIWQKKRES
nr:hypothetical protein [Anaerolineae bacterium]